MVSLSVDMDTQWNLWSRYDHCDLYGQDNECQRYMLTLVAVEFCKYICADEIISGAKAKIPQDIG